MWPDLEFLGLRSQEMTLSETGVMGAYLALAGEAGTGEGVLINTPGDLNSRHCTISTSEKWLTQKQKPRQRSSLLPRRGYVGNRYLGDKFTTPDD